MSSRLEEIEKQIQETRKKFKACKYDEIKKLERYMYFLKCEKRKIEVKMSSGRQSSKEDDKIDFEGMLDIPYLNRRT